MKTYVSVLLLAASMTLARAQNYLFTLTPAADGGGTRQGSGSGSLTLSGNILHITGSFTGLGSAAQADHIHGPGAPGVNAGILYDMTPSTTGITTYNGNSGTFNGDITLIDNTRNSGFTIAQQLTQLDSGLWYVNVHSLNFGGGEIRGQIVPVPEPSTFGLIGLGIGGALWVARFRRR